MKPCKFFAQGFCRNGDSCDFIHGQNSFAQNGIVPVASALPAIERLNIHPAAASPLNAEAKSTRVCTYFLRGLCNKGDKCWNVHPAGTNQTWRIQPDIDPQASYQCQVDEGLLQTSSDSRSRVPCKFLSRPGGCQNNSCPFLHTVGGHETEIGDNFDPEIDEDEGQERDDSTRDFSGASVYFNEIGQVMKISLPTDFSLASVTGFEPGTTPKTIVDILRGLGFNLDVDCVRIPKHSTLETKATIKVEDPFFAKELSAKLQNQKSTLTAVSMPMESRRTSCRKVHISWHKASRSAWINYSNSNTASRVARKFNEETYKCLGQYVKSSAARSSDRGGRGIFSYNPAAWTIVLNDIPANATSKDVKRAIISPSDKPQHVELGPVNYRATDAAVGTEVRLRLEEHGPLESFYLSPTSKGKRVKATAWFQDELDARSACSLNNRQLDILGKGKLTVALVHSAKVKVSTAIYFALKSRIDEESKTWKGQHLSFHVYPDPFQRFTTLKIDGGNTKDVTNARKTLDQILAGVVLMDGASAVWDSALNSNGSAYRRLKSIEKELRVVIIREKSKCQLQFYGPLKMYEQVVRQVLGMLKEDFLKSYEIDLKPHQFTWAMNGGFKRIERAVGMGVVGITTVPRRITINGTLQQYETALAIMDNKRALEIRSPSEDLSKPGGDCPICFCEAETPIQTSCKHTYCLECFEEYCKSASSTSKGEFQIQCQGDGGNCSTVFTLSELKDHISSPVFELVLKSSFEEYIQRRPEAFRYCPTPDCGYVYRCTTASSSKSLAYSCPNCFEPICTSCHARHGEYTCAEYKEIASGGYEALEKLKRELNIKDCPKCKTPMEKTEGCNHMTCMGCKAHICWVCMAVFKTSGPCYDHMDKEHGGIGLGLERFMDY